MPKVARQPLGRRVLALNVRYARTMLSLTQEELAERAGLHRTQVGALEREASGASIDSIVMLSEAIGVSPHVLLMPARDAQPLILRATEKRRRR